jgi:hypothetical protein
VTPRVVDWGGGISPRHTVGQVSSGPNLNLNTAAMLTRGEVMRASSRGMANTPRAKDRLDSLVGMANTPRANERLDSLVGMANTPRANERLDSLVDMANTPRAKDRLDILLARRHSHV